MQKSLKIDLSAVHINHGTRAEESDRDERFVVDLCKQNKVECTVYRLDGFTAESGENALRKARYSKFDQHLQNRMNAKMATAHHLDDQLETYLMRLFKGSGLKGLRGIPPLRGKFIRPLLSCSRQEINDYCRKYSIKFMDDSSNMLQNRLRNSVRHQIIPVINGVFGNSFLQQFEESYKKQFSFYSDAMSVYSGEFDNLITKRADRLELSCGQFDLLNPIRKLLILEYCFYWLNGVTFSLHKDKLKQFVVFNSSAQTGSLFVLHDKLHVLKDRSRLLFHVPEPDKQFIKELYKEQNVNVGDYSVSVISWPKEKVKFDTDRHAELINGDKITFPLYVRSWKEGDYFYPLGGRGKQKLSDFFINAKININRKFKIPIVENKGEIVWIGANRLDERYKITESVKKIYKIEIKHNDKY